VGFAAGLGLRGLRFFDVRGSLARAFGVSAAFVVPGGRGGCDDFLLVVHSYAWLFSAVAFRFVR
jgi:hypothetical protein